MKVFYALLRRFVRPETFNTNCFTLSSPGFFGSSQPGGEGGGTKCRPPPPPHHNFFVIGLIIMKLGKLVKCFKLYLMMGFWWVNWLLFHNIWYFSITCLLMVRTLFTKYRGANQVQLHFRSVKLVL